MGSREASVMSCCSAFQTFGLSTTDHQVEETHPHKNVFQSMVSPINNSTLSLMGGVIS